MTKENKNDGESIESAILVCGIREEYEYLEKRFGKRGKDWKLSMQALLNKEGRYYDMMVVEFPDGTEKTIYFGLKKLL